MKKINVSVNYVHRDRLFFTERDANRDYVYNFNSNQSNSNTVRVITIDDFNKVVDKLQEQMKDLVDALKHYEFVSLEKGVSHFSYAGEALARYRQEQENEK